MNDEAELERAKVAAFFSSNSIKQKFTTPANIPCSFLFRGLSSMGYVAPKPIQQNVIPTVLASRDVCASAVTGSDKNAAFFLPMIV
mmetsp:Transcript_14533/g.21429  ORF Transcript_14533/g.21429 Transcript_14533/m.21429 type:complete len:86 (+) Transcript_14533:2-259(+)